MRALPRSKYYFGLEPKQKTAVTELHITHSIINIQKNPTTFSEGDWL